MERCPTTLPMRWSKQIPTVSRKSHPVNTSRASITKLVRHRAIVHTAAKREEGHIMLSKTAILATVVSLIAPALVLADNSKSTATKKSAPTISATTPS
jgi:hypothetical protein